ncbi:phosphotransferase family protein [Halobaculum sp. CBA1158]|uniref:phosphotransferase family protein n=1 Tax=Halobaculum sp. CBA1158 TaxID=2904243 RepID=UPI001F2AB38E|nr:phosphotransferase family protein [Halobaculum sp. CBA1158]UIP00790.1 phosphotransferase family protein [Halobaculum sp. CBA1158]
MTDPADGDEEYFSRLVDPERLREYLAAELGSADDFDVRRHAEGHSNETLFVTHGDRELVIRRPPPGETADTAHDVLREYRVMDALQDTAVPLPETVLACEDHAVVGSDFYVMGKRAGDVLRDEEPERFAAPEHRRRVGEELVDTLSAVHAVDPESVGLGDFGRPAGFTERQVERWAKQFSWAFDVTAEERAVPEIAEVTEWLRENCPAEHEHALVHGDYKLDNVMFAPGTPPELVAVFDWELSALGDPLTDLGWMLSFWRDPGDPAPATPELTSTFMEREGYPSRRDLVARYEDATGIDYERDRFYRTLAVYKLAALGEMFYRRYLEGNSDDPLYPTMETRVPALAERCLRIVDGEEPL